MDFNRDERGGGASASDLAALLAARAEDAAEALLGTPNRGMSGRHQLRFGAKGSKAIELAGEKRGIWCDHESGDGGDLLDLAASVMGGLPKGIEWAKQWLGVTSGAPVQVPRRNFDAEAAGERERARLREWKSHNALEMFRAAVAAVGTVGETYLRWRGITLPIPPTFRFTPVLPHPAGTVHPALVCAIQGPDGKVTAVQRIWLAKDGLGKAAVPGAKRTLGPLGAGALRLAPVARHLGIAEGPETGLSAQQIFGLPVWVSCGASRMRSILPPAGVRKITIFGDNGEAGEREAEKAIDHFTRRAFQTDAQFPANDLPDFNDAVRPEGRQ